MAFQLFKIIHQLHRLIIKFFPSITSFFFYVICVFIHLFLRIVPIPTQFPNLNQHLNWTSLAIVPKSISQSRFDFTIHISFSLSLRKHSTSFSLEPTPLDESARYFHRSVPIINSFMMQKSRWPSPNSAGIFHRA